MNITEPTGFRLPGSKTKTNLENDTQRDGHAKQYMRIPGMGFLPNKFRNHFIAMVGEFIGTFLFLFFAFSATQVANASILGTGASTGDGSLSQAPNAQALMYIALAFGFSLAVNAWVFFRISGGLFNPAVTLGLLLIGSLTWTRATLLFISQMLGALVASAITSALFPSALDVSTTLSSHTSVVQGLFIEMFLTAELVFTIFMLAAEKHKATFIAPIGIGLALFVAELSGVYFTGGSLNPARSFGPCVINHKFPGYHWIYWLGPFLGSLLAVGFYHFVKHLEYETANPGQDFDAHEAEEFRVDEDSARAGDIRRASRTWRSNQDSFSARNDSQATAGAGSQQAAATRQRTLDGEYATDQESPTKDAFDISPALESGQSPLSMPPALHPK